MIHDKIALYVKIFLYVKMSPLCKKTNPPYHFPVCEDSPARDDSLVYEESLYGIIFLYINIFLLYEDSPIYEELPLRSMPKYRQIKFITMFIRKICLLLWVTDYFQYII